MKRRVIARDRWSRRMKCRRGFADALALVLALSLPGTTLIAAAQSASLLPVGGARTSRQKCAAKMRG